MFKHCSFQGGHGGACLNPSTLKEEAGASLISRQAWSTHSSRTAELHSDMSSQKTNKITKANKKTTKPHFLHACLFREFKYYGKYQKSEVRPRHLHCHIIAMHACDLSTSAHSFSMGTLTHSTLYQKNIIS